MNQSDSAALIIIDVQNDFCPGGALAVNQGDKVVPVINRMMSDFNNIVLTQDWHPADHVSFAPNHANAEPFSSIELDYGKQTLWPAHCVQGSTGAAFHANLDIDKPQLVIRKGFRTAIDSYSAFFENDHQTSTGLSGYLRERAIRKLVFTGLATDYCVAWSAIDAIKLGFDTTVVLSACRAIDLEGSLDKQITAMKDVGVDVVEEITN